MPVTASHSQRPKRRLNRGRVRRAALALSFLLLASVGVYFVMRSSLFTVRTITVQGATQISAEALCKESGIVTGSNIWETSIAEAEARVRSNPWVKTVKVSRRLPGEIVIAVSERLPVALVAFRTAYVEVDEAGVALEISDTLINRDYPLINGPLITRVVLGQPIDAPGVMQGIKAIQPLAPEIQRQISEVSVAADNSLTLILLSRARVYLGQADATLTQRVGLLPGILDDVAKQGIVVDYIDLRYEKNPVIGKK